MLMVFVYTNDIKINLRYCNFNPDFSLKLKNHTEMT